MKIGFWYLLIDDGIHPVDLGKAWWNGGSRCCSSASTRTSRCDDTSMPTPDQARSHPRVADPLTTLAVVAGERLTLGTSVLLADGIHPAHLVHSAQRLSTGPQGTVTALSHQPPTIRIVRRDATNTPARLSAAGRPR